jgi:hypothetical protein
MNILKIALDVIRGFVDISTMAIEWLTTPIGILGFTVRPLDAILPAGFLVWLAVVIIQVIRGK